MEEKNNGVPAGAAPIPSNRQGLLQLRDRLKAATGPDRELDNVIHGDLLGKCLHINTTWSGAQSDTGRTCDNCGADSWGNRGADGQRLHDRTPAYTASIDTALTLVPGGHQIENLGEMRDCGDRTGYWLVQFSPRGPRPRLAPSPITAATLRAACDGLPLVSAPTPALALCLARIEYEIARAATPVDESEEQGRKPEGLKH